MNDENIHIPSEQVGEEQEGSSRRDFLKGSAVALASAAAAAPIIGCAVKLNPKFDGPLMKVVRKVKQKYNPTQARVRWDTKIGAWAVLDHRNKPIRHFHYGFMTDVKFSSQEVEEYVGCGSSTTTTIGVADGQLVENCHGDQVDGFKNLEFKNAKFQSEGQPIHAASVLRLMSNRTAVFRPVENAWVQKEQV